MKRISLTAVTAAVILSSAVGLCGCESKKDRERSDSEAIADITTASEEKVITTKASEEKVISTKPEEKSAAETETFNDEYRRKLYADHIASLSEADKLQVSVQVEGGGEELHPSVGEGLFEHEIYDFDGDGASELVTFSYETQTSDLTENYTDVRITLYTAENDKVEQLDSKLLSKELLGLRGGVNMLERYYYSTLSMAKSEYNGRLYFCVNSDIMASVGGVRCQKAAAFTVKDKKLTTEFNVVNGANAPGDSQVYADTVLPDDLTKNLKTALSNWEYYEEGDYLISENSTDEHIAAAELKVKNLFGRYGLSIGNNGAFVKRAGARAKMLLSVADNEGYKLWCSDFSKNSEKWKNAYEEYFEKNISEDTKTYIVYLDDDDVPELVCLDSGNMYSVISFDGNEAVENRLDKVMGAAEYIPESGLIYQEGGYMYEKYGSVYQLKNGSLKELHTFTKSLAESEDEWENEEIRDGTIDDKKYPADKFIKIMNSYFDRTKSIQLTDNAAIVNIKNALSSTPRGVPDDGTAGSDKKVKQEKEYEINCADDIKDIKEADYIDILDNDYNLDYIQLLQQGAKDGIQGNNKYTDYRVSYYDVGYSVYRDLPTCIEVTSGNVAKDLLGNYVKIGDRYNDLLVRIDCLGCLGAGGGYEIATAYINGHLWYLTFEKSSEAEADYIDLQKRTNEQYVDLDGSKYNLKLVKAVYTSQTASELYDFGETATVTKDDVLIRNAPDIDNSQIIWHLPKGATVNVSKGGGNNEWAGVCYKAENGQYKFGFMLEKYIER